MRKTTKKILSAGIAAILSAVCLLSAVPAVTADTMSELESRQAQLEKEKNNVSAKLSEYEGKAEETEKYLEEYDNKMKIQEEQVENVQKQIEIYEADIAELEASIVEKEAEVDEGIEKFGQRLRALYMAGNDSLASVLTGSSDFYDMLARMEFVERVSKHDNELIDSLRVQISELEESKAKLQEKLAELEAKKAQEEQYLAELRETYNNHAETKKMQENMIADFKNRAGEIADEQQQVEAELQAEIRRLQAIEEQKRKEEEERRRKEEEERRKAAEAAGTEYVPPAAELTYSDTGFIWPVPTVRNMTDTYGYRTIAEEGGASDFHKGIDINKPGCYGEPIVASAGGTVITASNTGNGYGIHVVIDHGGKIATLYGHMSSCAVSVGDKVTQGQTIGYIGATGYAYGNHCHFEVRLDGQHTNPLNYVSINN